MVDHIVKQSIACNKQWEPRTTSLVDRLPLFFSAIVTLATLAWVLWYSHYGIDLTDESYYLVWMSDPFKYSVSVTQFGFVYHPLFKFFDGNIAAIRQANILITFGLSWVLVNGFLRVVFDIQSLESTSRLIISAAIATVAVASPVFSGLWLPTPSYNSLALQSLLIAATGLLLADKEYSRTSIAGWIFIGIGGWLAFMAKPTTAAALGVTAGVYLLLAKKLSIRFLAISLVTSVGLLVLSAITIDGSIFGFIDRVASGAELASVIGGGHTLAQSLRLDEFQLGDRAKLFLNAGTVVIFFAAYFSQVEKKFLVQGSTMLSISFAVVSLIIVFGLTHKTLGAGKFQGLLLWSVPFAAILAGIAIYRFEGLFTISIPQWALALVFVAFPHVYAFGSGANYWIAGTSAGIFWILAGLVLLRPVASNRALQALLLPLGLAVQLITVALVQTGLEAPYRQPQPLRANDYKLEIGKPGSTLMLSKGFGQYFAEAIYAAEQAGFRKGSPMIDLTGQSPGILYAMGASSIGQAWTIGGYPGSAALAIAMLKKISCEKLAAAWLLAEPEGPRKISPDILLSFGANLATDFQIVGTFKTAEGAGGYKEARVQQLLKPVRVVEDAMTACTTGRTPKQ